MNSTPLMPAAVLFDMDGTIVDTEPYWMAAEHSLVTRYNGSWSHEQGLGMVGQALDVSAGMLQSAGVALDREAIIDELSASVVASLHVAGLPARPGALELIRDLRDAGVPTALVTMSMQRMAEDVVSLIGFDAFDVVLGGDRVSRPKPYPDPYLEAARALGVDIRESVAIEDSVTGLTSAVASGAVALGVSNLQDISDVGAAEVWSTLAGSNARSLADVYARHRGAGTGST